MERYAWKATVKEGKIAEYRRRHDEIWQEMKDVLKEAGICNYSIWLVGNELLRGFIGGVSCNQLYIRNFRLL